VIPRALLLLLAALPLARAAAQTPTALLGRGIQSYRDMDMAGASQQLRSALAAGPAVEGALGADARKQALTYLGAAELYRDRRDSATAAFRRLVNIDPRYRPDAVVFPPDVISLFTEVRRSTLAVAVTAPPRATFGAGDPGLPFVLYASVRHTVVVTAETVLGEVVDTVHRGPVGDSLRLRWNVRGRGRTPPVGGMVLNVASLNRQGKVVRRVELPLQVSRGASERLETPPPPPLLPERQGLAKPVGRLTAGLGLAAISFVTFPEITGSDAAGVATGLVFTAGALVGFFEARPGKPLPENVAANAVTMARWRQQVEAIERSNRTRGDGPAVTVLVGEPVVRSGSGR
jgi:hypothetical protein